MPDEVEELPDLLTDLRATGRLESTGSFKVDYQRAAEQLARFRFQSPYEYVLKLVQAAVAGGAHELAIWTGSSGTSLHFDAAPFEGDDLADLSRWLLDTPGPGEGRSLAHLSVGLNAARALSPLVMEVSCWSHDHGVRLVADDEGTRVESVQGGPAGSRQTSIRILRPRRQPSKRGWTGIPYLFDHVETRSLGDCLAEVRSLLDSEFSQVWRRCALAPVPLTLNGRVVNRPLFGLPKSFTKRSRTRVLTITHPQRRGSLRRPSFVAASDAGLDLLPAPALQGSWFLPPSFPIQDAREFGRRTEFPPTLLRNRSIYIKLWELGMDLGDLAVPCHAMLRTARRPGRLRLVSDGVVVDDGSPPPELDGLDVLASAASLKMDLSGFRPVRDEAWGRLVSSLATVWRRSR